MITVVQKYGGTSVETPDHLLDVARRILEEKGRGRRLLVVVSAMGQTTDELVALARRVSPSPARREMDMLLTAGERISMALLAIALESSGAPAISFTGSQSGIITDNRHSDARIVDIRPFRIRDELEKDRIVIVAGFQGVSSKKEVTTLGRGGSDTTAVALAIHFGCPWCEIFTDVHGILTADPRIVPEARTLPRIDHETAIVLSHMGAHVVFRRAVILARKFGLPLRVRCSLSDGAETWIGRLPEEVAMERPTPNESTPMESNRILSVALEPSCASLEIQGKLPASRLLQILTDGLAGLCWSWVDVHRQPASTLVRAVLPVPEAMEIDIRERAAAAGAAADVRRDLATVSLVGEGILARPDLLTDAISRLDEAGIEVVAARSTSLSVSFLIRAGQGKEAVRVLHGRFVSTHP